MVEPFISHLYYGHISPWDRPLLDKQAEPFREKANDIKSRLKGNLSQDDFELLGIYENQFRTISSIEKQEMFARGFSMGILLMFEVMGFKEELDKFE